MISTLFARIVGRRTRPCCVLCLSLAASAVPATGEEASQAEGTPSSVVGGTALGGSGGLLAALRDNGIHPKLGSISDGSGATPGLVLWRPDLGGSGVDLFLSAGRSFREYGLVELRLGRVPHRAGEPPSRRERLEDGSPLAEPEDGGRLFYYADVRFRDLPVESFFGLGSGSRMADGTSYSLRDSTYDVVAGWRFSGRVAASVRAGLVRTELGYSDDASMPPVTDRFSTALAPGLSGGSDFLRVGSELVFDGRDDPTAPRSGSFLSVGASHWSARGRESHSFTRLGLDARRYQPLGSPRHVLALRATASWSLAGKGDEVPFYLQDTLGGSRSLRGYPTFRFRGERLVAGSAEYRFRLTRAVEAAAFLDGGHVSAAADAMDSGFVAGYGVGLRVKLPGAPLVRVDLGRGAEGNRVHLNVGYAF
jgi:hypothetical protein